MQFDLEKDTETVRFMLEKANIPKITAEVVADLDVSGSTRDMYRRGSMQEALQRIIPVALNFDDNGSVPVYTFNGGEDYAQLDQQITSANYVGFVNKYIIGDTKLTKWGSTDYAPVLTQNLLDLGFKRTPEQGWSAGEKPSFLEKLAVKWFGSKDLKEDLHTSQTPTLHPDSTSRIPAIIYFLTDGENSDKQETRSLLQQCADAGTQAYFNLIGIGHEDFSFLESVAREFPNVGFARIKDIDKVAGGDEIYKYLVPEELVEWLSNSKVGV